MKSLEKLRCLDATALKLIALASMLLDHVGKFLLDSPRWMLISGRIALPVFAFCVAEGFAHTRNKLKYLLRLSVFAVISELPFDLAIFGRVELAHQNVMLTFALAVAGLTVFESLSSDNMAYKLIIGGCTFAAFAAIALVLGTDYNAYGVILVFVFYLLRRQSSLVRNLSAGAYEFVVRGVGLEAWCLLSVPILLLYNGERGRGLKWLFYIFYPTHFFLIYIIRSLI